LGQFLPNSADIDDNQRFNRLDDWILVKSLHVSYVWIRTVKNIFSLLFCA